MNCTDKPHHPHVENAGRVVVRQAVPRRLRSGRLVMAAACAAAAMGGVLAFGTSGLRQSIEIERPSEAAFETIPARLPGGVVVWQAALAPADDFLASLLERGGEAVVKTPRGSETLRKGSPVPQDVQAIKSLRLRNQATLDLSEFGKNLPKADTLENLDLWGSRTKGANPNVWPKMPGLRTLNLGGTALNAQFLAGLVARAPGLIELGLDFLEAGDLDFACFRALGSLRTLSLRRSSARDLQVKAIGKLPALEHLDVSGTRITDAALDGELPKLRDLDVSDTDVSDACLARLARIQTLRSLNLLKTRVTNGGVRRLHAALPECAIKSDPGERVVFRVKGAIRKSSEADPTTKDGLCVIQAHHFEKGRKYSVYLGQHQGTTLNPYLKVLSPSGTLLAADDDSGGGLDARVVFEPKETAECRVVCTSLSRTGTGEFYLAISELDVPSGADDDARTKAAPLEVTANISLDPAKTYGRIVVKASNIVIDGKGATLLGASSGSPQHFAGTAIVADGVQGVTIKNVKARGWDAGLVVRNAHGWRIENCDFSDNFSDPSFGWGENGQRGGIVLLGVSKSIVRNCKSNRVWDGCDLVDSQDNLLEGNDFSKTSNTCLHLWNASRNVVRKNKLDYGIRIDPGEVHARDSACVLIECHSNDNLFADNSITHGGDGLFIRSLNDCVSVGNRFERNDVSYANNNCVECWSPRNVFVANKANHGSYGFWMGGSDQSVLLDNEASFNGLPSGRHNSPHLVDKNYAGHAGIVFMFGSSSHVLVRGNRCEGNNGAGIAAIGDLGSKGATWKAFHWILENNIVTGNRWGIYLRHADWLNLSGNVFRNNSVAEVQRVENVTNLVELMPNGKITQAPKVELRGPSHALASESFTLDASGSVDPAGQPLKFRWDLGDGTVSDRPRVEHSFARPGFYRIGLTVDNGSLSSLAWRDFYVVSNRPEHGSEGDAKDWTWEDPRSKVKFHDDVVSKIAGKSSIRADIDPYSGNRINLKYPAAANAAWKLEGKTHLVFWLRLDNPNSNGWQGPNPIVTLYESADKFARFTPAANVLAAPGTSEAREGWRRVEVPLASDRAWRRTGSRIATANQISIGFDSWGADPMRIWIDGIQLK